MASVGVGDWVYLNHDPDQSAWMVVQISHTPNGHLFVLARGTTTYMAYPMEISVSPNQSILLGMDAKQHN